MRPASILKAVRAVWRSSSLLPPPATIYAASPPWAQAPLPPFALLLPSSLPPSVACRLCIPSPARRRQSDQIKSSFAALHSPSVRPSVLRVLPLPHLSIPSHPYATAFSTCALPNDAIANRMGAAVAIPNSQLVGIHVYGKAGEGRGELVFSLPVC